MFWAIVGGFMAVVLLLMGISDLRRQRRSGRPSRIDGKAVTAGVRSARRRAGAQRSFRRYRGRDY